MSETCMKSVYLHQLNLSNIQDRYSYISEVLWHAPHHLGEVIKSKEQHVFLFKTPRLIIYEKYFQMHRKKKLMSHLWGTKINHTNSYLCKYRIV